MTTTNNSNSDYNYIVRPLNYVQGFTRTMCKTLESATNNQKRYYDYIYMAVFDMDGNRIYTDFDREIGEAPEAPEAPETPETEKVKEIKDEEVTAIYRVCEYESIKQSFNGWFYDFRTDKYLYTPETAREFAGDCVDFDLIKMHNGEVNIKESNRPVLAFYIDQMLKGNL